VQKLFGARTFRRRRSVNEDLISCISLPFLLVGGRFCSLSLLLPPPVLPPALGALVGRRPVPGRTVAAAVVSEGGCPTQVAAAPGGVLCFGRTTNNLGTTGGGRVAIRLERVPGCLGAAGGEDHDQFDTHWWSTATPAAGKAILTSRNPNVPSILTGRVPLMSSSRGGPKISRESRWLPGGRRAADQLRARDAAFGMLVGRESRRCRTQQSATFVDARHGRVHRFHEAAGVSGSLTSDAKTSAAGSSRGCRRWSGPAL
jgi:hypothetical protein